MAQALDATVGEGRDRYAGLRELGVQGFGMVSKKWFGWRHSASSPARADGESLSRPSLVAAQRPSLALAKPRIHCCERAWSLTSLIYSPCRTKCSHANWPMAFGSISEKAYCLTLDTYEIADRADMWLRVVIKRAGPNVVWVVAGRDNLAESRKYGQGYQPGYGADFTSDRLRVFSMNEFSVSDVTEYFRHCVPERPLDETTARTIHQADGDPSSSERSLLPSGRILYQTWVITGDGAPSRNRDKIVQTMTERFLMHCWDDPHDRQRLYALALAYQPDADLLSAMLDTSNLEEELSELSDDTLLFLSMK